VCRAMEYLVETGSIRSEGENFVCNLALYIIQFVDIKIWLFSGKVRNLCVCSWQRENIDLSAF
jgi:hypothetical protein